MDRHSSFLAWTTTSCSFITSLTSLIVISHSLAKSFKLTVRLLFFERGGVEGSPSVEELPTLALLAPPEMESFLFLRLVVQYQILYHCGLLEESPLEIWIRVNNPQRNNNLFHKPQVEKPFIIISLGLITTVLDRLVIFFTKHLGCCSLVQLQRLPFDHQCQPFRI